MMFEEHLEPFLLKLSTTHTINDFLRPIFHLKRQRVVYYIK